MNSRDDRAGHCLHRDFREGGVVIHKPDLAGFHVWTSGKRGRIDF